MLSSVFSVNMNEFARNIIVKFFILSYNFILWIKCLIVERLNYRKGIFLAL